MAKTYSFDLRERVVGFVGLGHSRRAAALHFDVSPSFAVKLMARVRETGSSAPARRGRPPGGGKLAPHRTFLIACVEDKPDITMPELAVKLEAERGIKAHPGSLSRILCEAGFTYKKSADGIGTGTLGHYQGAAGLDRPSSAEDAP